ncbi:MAG: phosphorothioated DNA-binding restriction endonuclease [Thiohalorhabdus sp.]|uniref:phosphorothioated DNA-binding restriction endonuclease n=1 Tax=Thiohalorhabdus sp. TaxID=3094134 RepID=UPI0039806756
MDRDQLTEKFRGLTIWKANGQRAPHKPLLVLLALGCLQRKGQQELPYAEIEGPMKQLLEDFGPPRQTYHPEYPFFHLQSDGVWELTTEGGIQLPLDRKLPNAGVFREYGVKGGFPEPILEIFQEDPEAVRVVAELLLGAHFPATYHEDLLQSVGLDLEIAGTAESTTRIRDPKFRREVLLAYGYRCAVCGLKIEMQDKTVAIEAAHIKWHQAGGPDHTANGLALCTLHHKLFDVGAFTLDPDLVLSVSSMAHGNEGFQRWLLDFNGDRIHRPALSELAPQPDFLQWHVREVFKGKGRYELNLN